MNTNQTSTKTALDDLLLNGGREAVLECEILPLSSPLFAEARWREEQRQERIGSGQSEKEEDSEAETEPDILPIFPALAWRGPFETYRKAMQGTTEATDVAHFAAYLVAAAARLCRRVWMPYGMTLYPNVNITLFGLTGDRKTTGARGTFALIPAGSPVKILRGVGSGEGLGDWLSTDEGTPSVSHLLFLEELSELLTRGRWEGATLLSFLTQVFDCPDSYELKFRKNPIYLTNPTLSSFACTTPALFWQHIREVDIHGGFANRSLYLTGPMKDPIALPNKPDAEELRQALDALAFPDIPSLQEAILSEDAQVLWKKFYHTWRSTELEPLLKALIERIPAYTLKLAMTYAALEQTLPVISKAQLKAAIAVGHYAVRCAELLLQQRTGSSRRGACEKAVMSVYQDSNKPSPMWKVHRKVGGRFSAEEIDRTHRALERLGVLITTGATNRGKPLFTLQRHTSHSKGKI